MPPPQTTPSPSPSPTPAPTKGKQHNPHLTWTTYSVSTTSTHGEGWVTLKPWPRPTPHAQPPSSPHEQDEAFQRPAAEAQEILDIVHGSDDGKQKMSWTTFSVSTTATTHGEGWVTLTPWPRPTGHASGAEEELEGEEGRARVLYEHDVSALPSSSRMMVGGGSGGSGCAHLSLLLHLMGIVVFVAVVARVLRASRERRDRGRIVLRDEEERGGEKV